METALAISVQSLPASRSARALSAAVLAAAFVASVATDSPVGISGAISIIQA